MHIVHRLYVTTPVHFTLVKHMPYKDLNIVRIIVNYWGILTRNNIIWKISLLIKRMFKNTNIIQHFDLQKMNFFQSNNKILG